MALALLTPGILAAAVAGAIAFAPTAAADDDDAGRPGPTRGSSQATDSKPAVKPPRASSRVDSFNSAPKGWSNEALWARPGPGGSNPFGTLPKPPVFAMD